MTGNSPFRDFKREWLLICTDKGIGGDDLAGGDFQLREFGDAEKDLYWPRLLTRQAVVGSGDEVRGKDAGEEGRVEGFGGMDTRRDQRAGADNHQSERCFVHDVMSGRYGCPVI